jgi:hypothetical protein
MTRIFRLLILASACGLSACTQVDGVITRGFASVNGLSLMSSFGGITAAPIPNSTTVQRVRAGGGNAGLDPLQPEEGNVWPPEEGPRATLANPDEALRGIPGYQPGTQANSPLPQRGESPARRPARGSDAAFEPPPGYVPPGSTVSAPVVTQPQTTMPGSAVNTGGTNRTITGSSGSVSTTMGPAGQSGVLLGRPGEVQILQEPGRPAQQILPGR